MKMFISLLLMLSTTIYAGETCSRVATINYQEVLVDAGTGKMGEGLRFYLEKDPISKSLLNKYQKLNKPSRWSASASTFGSLAIVASLLQNEEASGLGSKSTLLYGGVMLISLSYLTSKTVKFSNEKILKQAIDQYNKGNSPRIYFSPFKDKTGSTGLGFGLNGRF